MKIRKYNSELLELQVERTGGYLNNYIVISVEDLISLRDFLKTKTEYELKAILNEEK